MSTITSVREALRGAAARGLGEAGLLVGARRLRDRIGAAERRLLGVVSALPSVSNSTSAPGSGSSSSPAPEIAPASTSSLISMPPSPPISSSPRAARSTEMTRSTAAVGLAVDPEDRVQIGVDLPWELAHRARPPLSRLASRWSCPLRAPLCA